MTGHSIQFANFHEYTYNVTTAGATGGWTDRVTGSTSAIYDYGAVVQLTPTPSSG